jgi:putative RNA 2'-phosphotransferase
MTHPALIERITRSLAYMLRHQPEQFDLELDEYGYAELDDVVQALNERLGEAVEDEDVHTAVTSGDRVRYEIVDGRICALYGHSIEVKPGEPSKPPPLLFVGVSSADAERAQRYGLRAGRRRFLHLALTPDDALETGRRSARDYVVITVNALDAWEEGINFYDRKSLFLSDPIPTHFLEVGDLHSDGYGEEGASRRDERHARDRHAGHHERGAHGGSRPQSMPAHSEFVDREPELVPEHGSRGRSPQHESAPSAAVPNAGHEQFGREPGGHEPGGHEGGGRRRRRRGGRRPEEVYAPEGRARGPGEGMHVPRPIQDERRDAPRAVEMPRGDRGDLRERTNRSQAPRDFRGPRDHHSEEQRDFQRAPAHDRPRSFEPRREPQADDRRGGQRSAPERHVPPPADHRAPHAPASQPAAGPRGDFGSGIFEASGSPRPQRERAPAPPPREREPREAKREPKTERPDDSGFGAGI